MVACILYFRCITDLPLLYDTAEGRAVRVVCHSSCMVGMWIDHSGESFGRKLEQWHLNKFWIQSKWKGAIQASIKSTFNDSDPLNYFLHTLANRITQIQKNTSLSNDRGQRSNYFFAVCSLNLFLRSVLLIFNPSLCPTRSTTNPLNGVHPFDSLSSLIGGTPVSVSLLTTSACIASTLVVGPAASFNG